jgi:hypothetical protein
VAVAAIDKWVFAGAGSADEGDPVADRARLAMRNFGAIRLARGYSAAAFYSPASPHRGPSLTHKLGVKLLGSLASTESTRQA